MHASSSESFQAFLPTETPCVPLLSIFYPIQDPPRLLGANTSPRSVLPSTNDSEVPKGRQQATGFPFDLPAIFCLQRGAFGGEKSRKNPELSGLGWEEPV